MWDFVKAALPWVVMGVSIAILAVRHSRASNAAAQCSNEESAKKQGDYLTEGMCLGMCLGMMLGGTMFDSGMGMSLGMLVGMVIGMLIKK